MPHELFATAPHQPALRGYEDRAPGEGEVLVRTEFSACKHGTEHHLYSGHAPGVGRRYHPDWRLFVEPTETAGSPFPLRLGNMFVGRVEAVGAGVAGVSEGDRVYGWAGARDSHTVAATRVRPAHPELTPSEIVCLDPGEFAYGAVRDGGVRLGDRVAVFGLGAIGLLVVQLLRLAGASRIYGIDLVAPRRELAARLGADVVLDPRACDVGLAIHEDSGGAGLDVAIEYSGAPAALHDAIRSAGYMGTVAVGAWPGPSSPALRLGEEFHMNRTRIISTRACSIPVEDEPRWSYGRIQAALVELFRAKKLDSASIVTPIVPFAQAAEAYARIEAEPERFLKLGFTHG
jgi:threonine dehydrogenase-like Zn-dependent dehydrogenase